MNFNTVFSLNMVFASMTMFSVVVDLLYDTLMLTNMFFVERMFCFISALCMIAVWFMLYDKHYATYGKIVWGKNLFIKWFINIYVAIILLLVDVYFANRPLVILDFLLNIFWLGFSLYIMVHDIVTLMTNKKQN